MIHIISNYAVPEKRVHRDQIRYISFGVRRLASLTQNASGVSARELKDGARTNSTLQSGAPFWRNVQRELKPFGPARLLQLSRTSEPDHGKRIPGIPKKAPEKEADEALVKASVRPLSEDFRQEFSPQAERGETVRDVDQVRPPERLDEGATASKRRELVMLEDHLRDVGRPRGSAGLRQLGVCETVRGRQIVERRVRPDAEVVKCGREGDLLDSLLVVRRRGRRRQNQAEVGDAIRMVSISLEVGAERSGVSTQHLADQDDSRLEHPDPPGPADRRPA